MGGSSKKSMASASEIEERLNYILFGGYKNYGDSSHLGLFLPEIDVFYEVHQDSKKEEEAIQTLVEEESESSSTGDDRSGLETGDEQSMMDLATFLGDRANETVSDATDYIPETGKRLVFSTPNVDILDQGFPLPPRAASSFLLPNFYVFHRGLEGKPMKGESQTLVNLAEMEEESQALIGESKPSSSSCGEAAAAKRIEEKLSCCFN